MQQQTVSGIRHSISLASWIVLDDAMPNCLRIPGRGLACWNRRLLQRSTCGCPRIAGRQHLARNRNDPSRRYHADPGGERAGRPEKVCAVHCYVESLDGDRRIRPAWWLGTVHNVVCRLDRSIASNLCAGRNLPRRTVGGTNDAILSNFSAGSARK